MGQARGSLSMEEGSIMGQARGSLSIDEGSAMRQSKGSLSIEEGSAMRQTKGSLSIEEGNIFAILKRSLYSEPDIMFRELVSNAADAIAKRRAADGQAPAGEITVRADREGGRIAISDNGVGMTAEEVDRYINRIAFSGAADFVKAHGGEGEGVIGHFGVGFYSAFMAADRVEIVTRSCRECEKAVRWECDAEMNYSMSEGSRSEAGTDVILHVGAGSEYLSEPKRIYEALRKYFVFLDIPVYLEASLDAACGGGGRTPSFADDPRSLGEASLDAACGGCGRTLVNDPAPAWKDRSLPEDSSELAEFYKGFFGDVLPPIHCIRFESVDIGVRGMIFLRNTKNGTEEIDGTFKVYSKGVFIGDNIPSLIPKFVNLQSGIIDCRELPLVVSRESVSGNSGGNGASGGNGSDAGGGNSEGNGGNRGGGNNSVSGADGGGGNGEGHGGNRGRGAGGGGGIGGDVAALVYETLVQETTIAMNRLFAEDRGRYEALWPELSAFVKYAVIQDKTFASVMGGKVLFQDLHGTLSTIAEFRGRDAGGAGAANAAAGGAGGDAATGGGGCGASPQTGAHTIYYATDPVDQARYIEIFKASGMNALVFDHVIDQPFLRRHEAVHPDVRFVRIDSDLGALLGGSSPALAEADAKAMESKLRDAIGPRLGAMRLHIANLDADSVNMLIMHDERSRRMADMLEMYGMIKGDAQSAKAAQSHTVLLVNMNNSIMRHAAAADTAVSKMLLRHCFDLALLGQGALGLDDVGGFIRRSEELMGMVAGLPR